MVSALRSEDRGPDAPEPDPVTGGGAVIACVGVVHVYRAAGTDTAALRGVDLTVDAGERIALLGPSGSGKSTLLAIVAGIRQPSAGAVLIGGRDIARLPEKELRGYRASTVGTLLQGAANNLLDYATPLDNVQLTRQVAHRYRVSSTLPAAPELLRTAGLDDQELRTPVSQLSPSRQQACALAVAMANGPRVIAADEPTSQLDPAARDELLQAMLRLTEQFGTTVLVVTHDTEVAARMDRTLHLRDGRVGAQGRAAERLAVVHSDGSLPLPERLLQRWSGGSLVRIQEIGPNELRVTRVDE